MAKALKLPSGKWRVLVYCGRDDNGKQIRKSFTADTKREAEMIAAQYEYKKDNSVSNITVGDIIDKYIKSKENILSPTTLRSYRTMRNYNLQSIMNVKLSDLNRETIQNAVNEECLRLSSKSVRNAYGLISAALNIYAPDFNAKITLPKKHKIIRTMPDEADIINAVIGTSVELPVLIAIWLGMRMSEIRGLKKSDIKNGNVVVRRTVVTVDGEHIEKETTKTYESTRMSDIPPYILKLIDEVEGDYITTLTSDQLYRRFVKIQYENKIVPPISFHDLRHLNASVMVKLHIPDKYAMERGGWSTASTLRNVYQHTFSDERDRVNEIVNHHFESIVSAHESAHKQFK